MNAPDRYERFVVPEGMKKVTYERDMKVMNAASFTVQREDHTIGNVVRMQLHRDPNVLFSGYKLPHPLQYKVIIKVQTTSQSSPMQAYNQAINDLDKELDHLKQVFQAEMAQKQDFYQTLTAKKYTVRDKHVSSYYVPVKDGWRYIMDRDEFKSGFPINAMQRMI